MTKIPFYYFLLIAVVLSSCSQKIYYSKSNIVDSKIILLDSKFRIIERKGNKNVKHSGVYKLNDSTLTLIFNRNSTLPLITSEKNITVKSKSESSDRQKLTVFSAIDNNPSFLADVVLRDRNKRIIKKMNPNFNGEIILKNQDEISEIEISSPIDARTIVFDFNKYMNKNIEVKLQSVKWGGKTITNPDCGMVYPTQRIIVAKIKEDKNSQIKIFIDEKVYLAEKNTM